MHRNPTDRVTRNDPSGDNPSAASSPQSFAFDEASREALHEIIARRRDIRNFRPDPVPDDVLARILIAANRAGSVGFSQPWDFIVVRSRETRERLHAHVDAERIKGAERFEGERREAYLKFKLEGILDAPMNLCVTADRTRFGPAVLGRNTVLDADLYSTVCAVQNLWLAARAEGVGVGWVSILQDEFLAELLELPEHVTPVAYLCVGYPREFPERPTLETAGWLPRLPLRDLVHAERHGAACEGELARELEREA
jgi:5,6-dimethylbenzimidazole synthase